MTAAAPSKPSPTSKPSPRRLRALRLAWLLLVLALASVLSGHRQRTGPYPPVALTIVQADGTRTALMSASGWPLTLDMQVEDVDFLGFGHPDGSRQLPRQEDVGYLVFDNPDGCPSWLSPEWQRWLADGAANGWDDWGEWQPCRDLSLPWPRDESWLEITPGITVPDPETCGQRPFLRTFSPDDAAGNPSSGDSNRELQDVGPCVGSLQDGYGYGSHRRLPGLVVLADSGPGLITDEFFERPVPMAARNLAGFFQSVGYQVMSADGHTRINAHLNVPADLFTPLVVVDQGAPGLCPENDYGAAEATRVDGGPVLCDANFDADQHVVTVQAFLVDGHAEDEWYDMDQDGDIDADDVAASGYALLSNPATFQFRQLHEFPQPETLLIDLDGNGEAGLPPPAPAGPGGLTPPPR